MSALEISPMDFLGFFPKEKVIEVAQPNNRAQNKIELEVRERLATAINKKYHDHRCSSLVILDAVYWLESHIDDYWGKAVFVPHLLNYQRAMNQAELINVSQAVIVEGWLSGKREAITKIFHQRVKARYQALMTLVPAAEALIMSGDYDWIMSRRTFIRVMMAGGGILAGNAVFWNTPVETREGLTHDTHTWAKIIRNFFLTLYRIPGNKEILQGLDMVKVASGLGAAVFFYSEYSETAEQSRAAIFAADLVAEIDNFVDDTMCRVLQPGDKKYTAEFDERYRILLASRDRLLANITHLSQEHQTYVRAEIDKFLKIVFMIELSNRQYKFGDEQLSTQDVIDLRLLVDFILAQPWEIIAVKPGRSQLIQELRTKADNLVDGLTFEQLVAQYRDLGGEELVQLRAIAKQIYDIALETMQYCKHHVSSLGEADLILAVLGTYIAHTHIPTDRVAGVSERHYAEPYTIQTTIFVGAGERDRAKAETLVAGEERLNLQVCQESGVFPERGSQLILNLYDLYYYSFEVALIAYKKLGLKSEKVKRFLYSR